MRYIFVLLLFFAPLYGASKTSIEADAADYDGKKINMLGSVYIQHEFGNIRCDRAEMVMVESRDARFDPEKIFLYGSVEVILHNGSILTSDEAEIDCQTLVGVFSADAPQKVIYITRVEEEGSTHPVKTESRAMRVTMKKQTGAESKYVIDDIQAEGAVNIEYQVGE